MRGNTSTISLSAFKADWLTHAPMRDLCVRWTITRDQVIRLKNVWKLPPRHDRRLRAKPMRVPDPTTTEIQRACLAIQATWSDDVREDRRVVKTKPVTLARIEISGESLSACEYDGDADLWEANR